MINLNLMRTVCDSTCILDQCIGRVHRYGQKNKVSVINFVSSGTIEHRMIGVLNFKSSLFDGILYDGEDSIFMGEDKFREFMKTVEGITAVQGVRKVTLLLTFPREWKCQTI